MTIKGVLNFNEYRKYQMNFALPRYIIIFVILSTGVYIFKFGSQFAEKIPLPAEAGNIIISIIFSLIITLFLFSSFYIRLRSLFYSDNALKIEQVYNTTDEGINMKNERGEFTVKWDEIKKASYYKDYILIFTSTSLAILLPHRFFNSQSELEEFRLLINKKLKK
jgi:hypothetical protein